MEMKSLRETLTFDSALLRGKEAEIIEEGWDGCAVLSLEKLPETILVAVHNGQHHGDEVFAAAILQEFFISLLEKDVEFLQTRDPKEWAKAHLVVDVGEGLLDHHGARAEAGVAACTRVMQLLYQTFAGPNVPEKFWEILDDLQKRVSAVDTGVSEESPFPWLATAVRASQILEVDNFANMVKRVRVEIEEKLLVEITALRAQEAIEKAIAKNDEVVIFPAECRWGECKKMMWERKHPCIFYVSPESEEDWRVLCAADPTAAEFSNFSSRKLIPEKYRGLRGEDLSERTGIQGGIFSHSAGFIAGFKTREGAEAFARLCLKN